MLNKIDIWNRICEGLQSKLTDDEFRTWFSQATLKELDFDLALIVTPNKFVADWLEDKYLPEIKKAFKTHLNQSPHIRFTYDTKGKVPRLPRTRPVQKNSHSSYSLNINPSMTFERFVTGECKRFAYSSAIEVARQPADIYNPLYIFSASGLGKTHLLHAVGNSIMNKNPTCRIRYLSADSFTSDFTYSIKNEKLHEFRAKYSDLEIFLFDDIHLLANRKRTQDEFLFIFNMLHDKNRQLVISGDKPPHKLRNIKSQLASRLGWGLLTEIKPPDTVTKVNIIKSRAGEDHILIPDDVLFFFANSVMDVKGLINNMVRFETYASLNDGMINISAAKSLIRDVPNAKIGIEYIKTTVAGFFGLSVRDLISDKKKRTYSYPRQLAMYLARKYTHLSYQQIGDAFGHKNHSTVIYAIQRVTKNKDREKEIRNQLNQIENLLS